MPCPLSVSLSKSGPFPRPALPGVLSLTGLSATPPARPTPQGSGWCVHTTDRASRVATSSIFHACRRHYPGGYVSVLASLYFPIRHRPSPNYRRVGSRIALFEACSAFTRVPACTVAELLNAALCHRSASDHVVTSMTRFGCYQPKTTIVGWNLHPLGKRAFPRRTAILGLVYQQL